MNSWKVLMVVLLMAGLIQPATVGFIVISQSSTEWVIESSTLRGLSGGSAYPGSRNSVLSIDARYMGQGPAISPYACFVLPDGFTPVTEPCVQGRDADGSLVTIVNEGDVVRFSIRVNIDPDLPPSKYVISINITYYVGGEKKWEYLSSSVSIDPYPPLRLEVVDVYSTPYSHPGSYPVSLVIRFINRGESTITGLTANYEFQEGIAHPTSGKVDISATIPPQGSYSLVISGIMVSPETTPGRYYVRLFVSADLSTPDGVSYRDSATLIVYFMVDKAPDISVRLLDYGLTSQRNVPGIINTGLRILVQNIDASSIRILYMNVSLKGAVFTNGSTTRIVEIGRLLDTYDVLELVINGVNIANDTDMVVAHIELHGVASSNTASYTIVIPFRIVIPLDSFSPNITLIRSEWSRGEIYPGSTGNTMIVTFLNGLEYHIRDAHIWLVTPTGFTPASIVQFNIELPARSVTEIVFNGIDVSSELTPGEYVFELHLLGYVVFSDGSLLPLNTVYHIKTFVEDYMNPRADIPVPEVSSYFWGEYTPSYVYQGNSRAPLTLYVRNPGPYPIYNLIVDIDPSSRDVSVLNRNSTCSAMVDAGGVCSVVFYLDVSNASPGMKAFTVSLYYQVRNAGTLNTYMSTRSLVIQLPNYSPGAGLVLVYSGWRNDYPVFPGSRKAIFTLVFSNYEPYPIGSVRLSIGLPVCFSLHEGYPGDIYIPGPLPSLQSFTANLVLDNECKEAGVYNASIRVEYYVQSGNPAKKVSLFNITMRLQDPSAMFTVINMGWVGQVPTIPLKKGQYYVVLRNNGFPTMSNIVVQVRLPEGFKDPLTGSSVVNASVYAGSSIQQITSLSPQLPAGIAPEQISQLISALPAYIPASSSSPVNKGDIFIVTFPVEVSDNVVETVYDLPLSISFIDHWGELFEVNITSHLVLVSRPQLIDIEPISTAVYFVNGTGTLGVKIRNNFNSSIYDVYVILVPITGNAIPIRNTAYIPKISAYMEVMVNYTLVYNPITFSTGGISVTQPSAVFTVALIYRDAEGSINMANYTLATIVKPAIDLVFITPPKARVEQGILTVTGVLLNQGLATARNVLAIVEYDGKAATGFIGDVDPGGQMPFRVELENVSYTGSTCTLIIKYLDDYNTIYTTYTQLVPEIGVVPSPQSPASERPSDYRSIIIAMIAVFLIAVFVLIYWQTRRIKFPMVGNK